jgi:hypothetical protein
VACLWNSERWTKSRNLVVMSVTHHRQNPLECRRFCFATDPHVSVLIIWISISVVHSCISQHCISTLLRTAWMYFCVIQAPQMFALHSYTYRCHYITSACSTFLHISASYSYTRLSYGCTFFVTFLLHFSPHFYIFIHISASYSCTRLCHMATNIFVTFLLHFAPHSYTTLSHIATPACAQFLQVSVWHTYTHLREIPTQLWGTCLHLSVPRAYICAVCLELSLSQHFLSFLNCVTFEVGHCTILSIARHILSNFNYNFLLYWRCCDRL